MTSLYTEREGKARCLLVLTAATFGDTHATLHEDVLFSLLHRLSNEGLLNTNGEAVFRMMLQMQRERDVRKKEAGNEGEGLRK